MWLLMSFDINFMSAVMAFLLLAWLFESWLDWRQYRKYGEPFDSVPDLKLIEPPVTEKEFNSTQAYGRDKKSFGMVKGAWSIFETMLVLYFGVLPMAWTMAGSLVERMGYDKTNEAITSCVFMFSYSIIEDLINQPWGIYFQFVIEERHGFNKMTARLYVTDWIKSQALGIVIGAPIMTLIIWVVRWGGPHFYVYVWGTIAVIQIVMMTIYPILIAPLFNKFTPLEEGPLRTKIEALAASLSFPLTKLFVIDGSTRSSHSNAYMYGFWWNKRIVLYDTLLSQTKNEQDVVAVLAHELGHWKMNHTTSNLIIAQILLFTNFFCYGLVMNTDQMYTDFGFESKPVVVGLLLFSFLFSPVEHVIGFCMNMMSRKFEYEADAFAQKLGYADNLRSGLVAISKENKGDLNPDGFYSAYHHSHPTLVERLKALRPKKTQ